MSIIGRGLPKAVLFDLDGTLVDSAPDIAAAVNELLATRKLPALIVPQVTLMIGNGVEKLVERAFAAVGAPLEGAALLQANRDMAPIYLRHVTEHTTLMPGVREALAVLHVGGVKLGVVTNKPQAATREILVHFGLLELLKAVVGVMRSWPRSPPRTASSWRWKKCGVGPAGALLVGDSLADVGAAARRVFRSC
jgi:phosphoglycolate phosphatase